MHTQFSPEQKSAARPTWLCHVLDVLMPQNMIKFMRVRDVTWKLLTVARTRLSPSDTNRKKRAILEAAETCLLPLATCHVSTFLHPQLRLGASDACRRVSCVVGLLRSGAWHVN